MNYIKEMNAFYNWLEFNEVSPSAINLWYALMHIHNKTSWASSFTVAESVLSIKTGLSGRTIRNARAELVKLNRIRFVSTPGKAPKYTMHSLVQEAVVLSNQLELAVLPETVENSVENSAEVCSELHSGREPENLLNLQRVERRSVKSTGVLSEVASTLVKQNETKQKKNNPHSLYTQRTEVAARLKREEQEEGFGQLATFFEKEVGPLTPFVGEILDGWVSRSGVSLAKYALQIAVKERAKHKVKYAEAVLKRWEKAGIRTLVDAQKAYEKPLEKQVGSSLFTPSKETLRRQKERAKTYERTAIDVVALPY